MEFVVTKEFIESIKTANGGYIRKQLDALGVGWPPPKGWKKEIVGASIPRETALWLFEQAQASRASQ